jgi:hypothetical protein
VVKRQLTRLRAFEKRNRYRGTVPDKPKQPGMRDYIPPGPSM